MSIEPDAGRFGVARNRLRIDRLGIPLYLAQEEYVLDPDGTGVEVIASERFGPIPFLFRDEKRFTAVIHEGGHDSTYSMPLLGRHVDGPLPHPRRRGTHRRAHRGVVGGGAGIDGQTLVTVASPLELHERLDALSGRLEARARELDRQQDSRAVFTHAYSLMTAQIAAELPTDPGFDPSWTVGLAEAFAARYFAALDAFDRGEGVPPRGTRSSARSAAVAHPWSRIWSSR